MRLEGTLYRPLVWSVAVALLASGALLSVQMISEVVGPFRLSEIGATDPRTVVALWRPIDAVAGAAARSTLAHELVESGRAVREVAVLGNLDPARTGAIVLSEPRRLDAAQIEALVHYVEAGGGAVLLGSVAVRDADGEWRGYDAMSRVLGAPVVAIESARAEAIQAARRGPISSALLPRQRVAVAAEPELPALLLPDAELRWTGAEPDARAPAASLATERGAGRLAWLAVDPERATGRPSDRARLRAVLEAAVAWVSRTAWVEVLPWPDGARFGGVVEPADDAEPDDREARWDAAIDAAVQDAGLAELPLATAHAAGAAQALADASARVRGAGGWLANRRDLSDWTRARAAVTASVRRTGPRRLILEVTNVASSPVEELVLRLHLNEPARIGGIQATKLGQDAAHLRSSTSAERVDVVLPRLEPRRSAAYHVDTEPIAGPG